ncbi:MAG: ABC transporter ATP-binding protein [Nitrospinota bacterium]|nr:ABC transporter ATP-binding protein [Nitrospinota bacterium]
MIEIKNLTKSLFGGGHRVDILNGIDIAIDGGQFLAVTGSSGSGKTTLLSLIAGLDTPTAGSILIDGNDITRLNEDELALLRSKRFGFVFQSFHLIPTLTAIENVALASELNSGQNSFAKAESILGQVGLADRFQHYPSQLSGGEQQRLSLARAFVNEPDIVLADEPTGNLDSKNSEIIIDLMRGLHQSRQATVILVTHEPHVAAAAQRTLLLEDGRVTRDTLNEPSPK